MCWAWYCGDGWTGQRCESRAAALAGEKTAALSLLSLACAAALLPLQRQGCGTSAHSAHCSRLKQPHLPKRWPTHRLLWLRPPGRCRCRPPALPPAARDHDAAARHHLHLLLLRLLRGLRAALPPARRRLCGPAPGAGRLLRVPAGGARLILLLLLLALPQVRRTQHSAEGGQVDR